MIVLNMQFNVVTQFQISIEQHIVDTNGGKKLTVLSCHRCLINTGVGKMNII